MGVAISILWERYKGHSAKVFPREPTQTASDINGELANASRRKLFVFGGALLITLTCIGGILMINHGIPGTRLVYEIEGANVSVAEIVEALQQRLGDVSDFGVRVRAQGSNQVEVLVASRDRAKLESTRQLIESAGGLRFAILANRVDHQPLIKLAIGQADTEDSRIRMNDTVNDEGGNFVAFWANVDRERTDGQEKGPFRVNVSDAIVRKPETGEILDLPSQVRGEDGEQKIAEWVDKLGISGIETLLIRDPLCDVTGEDVAHASSTFDEKGSPAVAFTLTDSGSGRFFALTTNNAPVGSWQRQLGIVLDGNLLSAPSVLGPIRKEVRITGRFKRAEVDSIVEALRAPHLSAKLRVEPISESPVEVPFRLGSTVAFKVRSFIDSVFPSPDRKPDPMIDELDKFIDKRKQDRKEAPSSQ